MRHALSECMKGGLSRHRHAEGGVGQSGASCRLATISVRAETSVTATNDGNNDNNMQMPTKHLLVFKSSIIPQKAPPERSVQAMSAPGR